MSQLFKLSILLLVQLFLVPGWAEEYEITKVLEKDVIRAIDHPKFSSSVPPSTSVIGVEINGEARAYPIAILSSHEVVNDVVGGIPITVTW